MSSGNKSSPSAKRRGGSMLPMVITQPQKKNNNANPLRVKGTPATSEEALERVNANNYNKDIGYQVNCQRCVWGYKSSGC